MGFLTNQQCGNCESYDTGRIYENDSGWDEAVEYIFRSGHGGTIKIYKCKKCNEYVFFDHDRVRY